jgi:hypothetical protein
MDVAQFIHFVKDTLVASKFWQSGIKHSCAGFRVDVSFQFA